MISFGPPLGKEVKFGHGGQRSLLKKLHNLMKTLLKRFEQDILMVYKLEPFKDFILTSEVKVDLVGERSVFEKEAQFNEKYC